MFFRAFQNLFVKFTRALQGDFYKHFTSSRMNLNSYVLVVTNIMISTCHEYPDWNTCILLAHNERFNFLKLLTDTKFVPSKLFNFPNWKGWKVKISCKVTGCHGKLMNFMQLKRLYWMYWLNLCNAIHHFNTDRCKSPAPNLYFSIFFPFTFSKVHLWH